MKTTNFYKNGKTNNPFGRPAGTANKVTAFNNYESISESLKMAKRKIEEVIDK